MVPKEILTERFKMRPLCPDDATEQYSRWLDSDDAYAIEGSRAPHAINDLRDYIRARQGRGDALFLGIFSRDDGSHIGNVKYEPINEAENFAVMGILVGELAWKGRGVAGEVIAESAKWLSVHRGIRDILLGVETWNVAAIRAYKKLGFSETDTKRLRPKPGAITMILRVEEHSNGLHK